VARDLAETYDYIFLEDLNLESVKKKWGRKVSDLSFGTFVRSQCGYKNDDLTLRDRSWICPSCHTSFDRDLNASINILREGASSLGLGNVRPETWAVAV